MDDDGQQVRCRFAADSCDETLVVRGPAGEFHRGMQVHTCAEA
jgi:hypothetical protein